MTKYLFIGPHPDDVEIGAGGVMISLLKDNTKKEIMYVTMSNCMDIDRNVDIIAEHKNVTTFYCQTASPNTEFSSKLHDFKNRQLFEQHMEIRKQLEFIRNTFNPDIVFSTSPNDIHQDHSYIGEEVFRVFRNSSILCYEVPRSTNTLQWKPHVYMKITKEEMHDALKITELYVSQQEMEYMEFKKLKATYIHRGTESGQEYAQAFEILRLCVKPNNFLNAINGGNR